MSRESKYHATAFNPSRRIAETSAQPCGPLSDELELDCCEAGQDAGLENTDVPLTTAEPASANAIKRHSVMF
jgi:hypothetical protein